MTGIEWASPSSRSLWLEPPQAIQLLVGLHKDHQGRQYGLHRTAHHPDRRGGGAMDAVRVLNNKRKVVVEKGRVLGPMSSAPGTGLPLDHPE